MGLLAYGLLMCVAGALIARYGYGRPNREDFNGVGPAAWKAVGATVAAIGVVVVLVGALR
jgi:hypothetical protein